MFYKLTSSQEYSKGDTVISAEYSLIADQKDTYDLPVDGWYWFDTDSEADSFFFPNGLDRTVISSSDFLDRFTQDEMIDILNAAKTNVNVELLLLKLNVYPEVVLNSSETINGIDYFVSQGLLTATRAEQILSQ
jgi:hypothetical protein